MSTTFTFEHVNRLKTTHLQRDTRSVVCSHVLVFSLCSSLAYCMPTALLYTCPVR